MATSCSCYKHWSSHGNVVKRRFLHRPPVTKRLTSRVEACRRLSASLEAPLEPEQTSSAVQAEPIEFLALSVSSPLSMLHLTIIHLLSTAGLSDSSIHSSLISNNMADAAASRRDIHCQPPSLYPRPFFLVVTKGMWTLSHSFSQTNKQCPDMCPELFLEGVNVRKRRSGRFPEPSQISE